jgi:hypothetical protein
MHIFALVVCLFLLGIVATMLWPFVQLLFATASLLGPFLSFVMIAVAFAVLIGAMGGRKSG